MNLEFIPIITTLGLYAVAVVSPGPSFALVSRLAVSGSRFAAIGASFGLALAAAFYAILTMTGLALLLSRIGWVASLVQIAGGCYLVYLGAIAWLSSRLEAATQQQRPASRRALHGFRMGILVNLSNPKGIAFFLSLYAVAVPPETAL